MLITHESAQRVVDRWILRQVVRRVCASDGFQTRTSALQDLTPQVMEAFGQAFILSRVRSNTRIALFGGVGGKIKKLWGLFKKAPQLWGQIKEFLGIKGLRDAPRKIKEWARKGLEALTKVFGTLIKNNPFAALYLIPHHKMPGLTDMLTRVGKAHPKLKLVLDKVNQKIVKPFDELLAKSVVARSLARPILAAAFIWIWLHVSEVSWDIPGIVKGFTGGISVGELLGSLPESGIGFVVALLFPGLGTFSLLPATIMARLTYLLLKKIIVWVKGKGFLVDWTKLGKPELGREIVSAL